MTLTLESCVQTAFYVYAILSYLTARGLRAHPEPETDWEPGVSVIVAAAGKAGTIEPCLDSFRRMDYPADKLEFILVNDGFDDEVEKRMKRFLDSGRNGRLIETGRTPGGNREKSNGLLRAAGSASGEVLFFTEGDCEVPATWIRSLLKLYAPGVGLAAGFVDFRSDDRRGRMLSRIQSLDWIHSGAVGSGWANLGYALNVFGKNCTVRRSAIVRPGGIEPVRGHKTADFTSFRKILEGTPWKLVWAEEETGAVYSKASPSWKEYYRMRRLRTAGEGHGGVMALTLTGVALITRLSIVVCAASGDWKLALLGFWSLMLADGAVLSHPLFALGRVDLFGKLFAYELFRIVDSVFIIPFFLITSNGRWKSGFKIFTTKTQSRQEK